jgi:periplasmic divalent cation tolerance protein
MPDTELAPHDVIVVLTTAADEEQANRIAHHLVESRLVACVNIVPRIGSIYRWKGKVIQEAETLMIMKTRRAMFEHVRTEIRSLHTYELPEVIALAVGPGDPEALAWILESASGA